LLLPEIENFEVVLASNLVAKDQTGLLARSQPTGNVRGTNAVGLQGVAASAEQLRVRLIPAVVVHDAVKAPVEDLLGPSKGGDALAR
jgi:hypothetical protein